MTNEQAIRSMTTERLAKYLYSLGNGEEYCYGHCAYQDDKEKCSATDTEFVHDHEEENCLDGIVKWLRSENAGCELY